MYSDDYDNLPEEAVENDEYGDFFEPLGGDYGEENVYEAEAKAFERVGGSTLEEMLEFSKTGDKYSREIMMGDGRFLILTDAHARELQGHGVDLSEQDITYMLKKTEKISDLKYRNPWAYILGYLATEGGKTMEKDRVLSVIYEILPKIDEKAGVEPPDVIRYARFWKFSL